MVGDSWMRVRVVHDRTAGRGRAGGPPHHRLRTALLLDDFNLTKFTPFPGAPVYRNIREQGEFHEEWPAMNCMNFVFVPHGMTKQRLEELYNEFIRSFYRRPRIHLGYAGMLWKSPHSIKFMRNLPEIIKFEMKQKW
jgi:hypothetical protein